MFPESYARKTSPKTYLFTKKAILNRYLLVRKIDKTINNEPHLTETNQEIFTIVSVLSTQTTEKSPKLVTKKFCYLDLLRPEVFDVRKVCR